MENMLLAKLRRNEVCLGVGLMYPNPNAIESMGKGWDWVWIDGQHGQLDYAGILHAVQVGRLSGLPSVTRVPGHAPDFIGQVLDTGTDGLMAPMVDAPDMAEAIVRAAYFPPLGARSYGGRRVIDCGGRDYYLSANDQLLVIAQIETPQAVTKAHEIAAVEGVDALFFSSDDMKVRMGIPINTPPDESPELLKLMEQTARAALDAGKIAGCVAASAPALKNAVSLGYRLIVGGADAGFLRTASAAKLEELRAALGTPAAVRPSGEATSY